MARPTTRPSRGLSLALLLSALALSPATQADITYVEQDAWFGTVRHGPGATCTLNTGGYDQIGKTQNPALSITLRQRDDGEPRIELTATAVTTASRADLVQMRTTLRVVGTRPMTVPAVPSAITETSYDRRLTLRPLFAGDDDAGMRLLIAAMRDGERLLAEINARPLEPAFSLRGFDKLWRQAMEACGAATAGY